MLSLFAIVLAQEKFMSICIRTRMPEFGPFERNLWTKSLKLFFNDFASKFFFQTIILKDCFKDCCFKVWFWWFWGFWGGGGREILTFGKIGTQVSNGGNNELLMTTLLPSLVGVIFWEMYCTVFKFLTPNIEVIMWSLIAHYYLHDWLLARSAPICPKL